MTELIIFLVSAVISAIIVYLFEKDRRFVPILSSWCIIFFAIFALLFGIPNLF